MTPARPLTLIDRPETQVLPTGQVATAEPGEENEKNSALEAPNERRDPKSSEGEQTMTRQDKSDGAGQGSGNVQGNDDRVKAGGQVTKELERPSWMNDVD